MDQVASHQVSGTIETHCRALYRKCISRTNKMIRNFKKRLQQSIPTVLLYIPIVRPNESLAPASLQLLQSSESDSPNLCTDSLSSIFRITPHISRDVFLC
jgi:hypothetical protein